MNISILSPDGKHRSVLVSKEMEAHFAIPINHAHTILNQINGGMYAKWFKGKQNLVVMDFGANVGLVSLYVLPACKELHCIEPTPSHFALLQQLINANISENQKAVFYPWALTGTGGEYQFATGHSTENKVTSAEGYGNHKITVKGETLIHFIEQASNTIDFCKIDIEGGEMMALTETQIAKTVGKVRTFFVEVHPAFGGGMEENYNELTNRFKKCGYAVEQIDYQTFVAMYSC